MALVNRNKRWKSDSSKNEVYGRANEAAAASDESSYLERARTSLGLLEDDTMILDSIF
jgi:hypothetical protein